MKRNSPIFYGWIIVATGFVSLAIAYGIRHSFPAAFYPAILDEFGWSRATTASIFSLILLVYGLSALIGGTLVDRFGPRRVLASGALLLALGTALSSQARELWHFYLTFGVLTAFGIGLLGITPLVTVLSHWFVRRRGMALGFLTTGGGVSYVFAAFTQYLILRVNWPAAYLVLAAIVTVVLLPLVALVPRHRPQDMGLLPDDAGAQAGKEGLAQESGGGIVLDRKWASIDWTLSNAMGTVRFWSLVSCFFLFWGIALSLMTAHQRVFISDIGFSAMFAATIFGIYGVFFGLGQLCGFISDRLGREMTFTLGILVSILGMGVIFLIRDAAHPWLPYLYALTFGWGTGICAPTLVAATADLFQGRNFGSIMGCCTFGFSMGGVISPWLGGWIYDVTGSYTYAFILVLFALMAASALLWMAAPRKVRAVAGRAHQAPDQSDCLIGEDVE